MFNTGPNYVKLKTNLRLALNRLQLVQKKKMELVQKARKEIADHLAAEKIEKAKIRVEHIIREDYLIEAMEMVEMYCDLLVTRFGLISHMKTIDESTAEAIYSLVWIALRLQNDIPELKVISDVLVHKYGQSFAESARTATGDQRVSEKLMNKLNMHAPPKLLVEKYLIAIAKSYDITYVPDPQIMQDDPKPTGMMKEFLIDLSDKNNLGGSAPPPELGFREFPEMPPLPGDPKAHTGKPFFYPALPPQNAPGGGAAGMFYNSGPPPIVYNIPPNSLQSNSEKKDFNTDLIETKTNNSYPNTGAGSPDENNSQEKSKNYPDPPPRYSSIDPCNLQNSSSPKPQPRSKMSNIPGPSGPPVNTPMPNLPSVPSDLPDIPHDPAESDEEIDFDKLFARFEELKKQN